MKIAFNPSTVAALIAPPDNKDITFDLRGQNIFARGVKFCGTDTNTWRDIKINNISIGSNILDLRNGSNTTLTNTNGVVTINSTWRPVVDNLTSNSTTSSLSANLGRILKALIDGKSDSEHTHDDRYLRLTGGWMSGDINFGDDNKIYWGRNTDSASISFKNNGDGDADSYMSFVTSDNGNEYFRWSHSSGSTNTEWMALRSDGLRVGGTKVSLEGHTHNDLYYTKTEVNNKLNGKSDTSHTHDDRYLKLTGGTMSGTIYKNSGGATISGRDNAIIRLTYAPGDSSWNPIACVDTETGTWTLGHLSSGDSDTNFHFCFSTNADYNAGNNNGNYVTLRNKIGTIALLSEIPDKNSWNYDDRYYTKVESNAKYITDITTSVNKLTFTKNGANIAKDITVNVVYNLGNLTNISDKNATTKASSGLFIYNSYNLLLGTNLFSSVLSINTGGTIQIAGNWGDDTARNLYWRSLSDRNVADYPWKSWRTILDSENTYVSNNKGYINGLEITLVNNADTLDGYHARDFVKIKLFRFNQYNQGTWTKILTITINSTADLLPVIAFSWIPSECSRTIWADFSINWRSNFPIFYAIWKGMDSRTLKVVNSSGAIWDVWVSGSKTGWDPYGEIQVTYTHNITSYNGGSLEYSDTDPGGTICITGGLVNYATSATKLATARSIWGQSFDGTGDVSGDMTDVGIINTILNLKSRSGNASLYLETVTANTDYAHLFVTNKNDKNNVSRPLILQNGYGNVGIGTNSPSYKLHVDGSIFTTTGFKKNGSSDSYVLLGGGGHKAISDFVTSDHNHDNVYLKLTGGTMLDLSRISVDGDLYIGDANNNGWLYFQDIASLDGVDYWTISTDGNASFYAIEVTDNISVSTMDVSKYIQRPAIKSSWVAGRDNALLRDTSSSGYHTLWSLKTTNGSWEFGEYNNPNWYDVPVLSYVIDTDYATNNNQTKYQIKFPLASGTVALTSDIKNPTNYYWANVKVSASSNTQTQPSVNTIYASNWFRSQGASGWYSENYEGGIYMTDSSWVKVFNNKGFYTKNTIKGTKLLVEGTNQTVTVANMEPNLLILGSDTINNKLDTYIRGLNVYIQSRFNGITDNTVYVKNGNVGIGESPSTNESGKGSLTISNFTFMNCGGTMFRQPVCLFIGNFHHQRSSKYLKASNTNIEFSYSNGIYKFIFKFLPNSKFTTEDLFLLVTGYNELSSTQLTDARGYLINGSSDYVEAYIGASDDDSYNTASFYFTIYRYYGSSKKTI